MTEFIMQSLRRAFGRPRIDDWSPLAQFYYADEKLNAISAEIDAHDPRRDQQRCTSLMNKLRACQDRLLHIIEDMLRICFPHQDDRAPRDYRVKFPDDIVHDHLPGQLWFGAECLAAGSNIIDHEYESEAIRPLARALVRHLERLRSQLREQAVRNPNVYPPELRTNLHAFDFVFAEFELNYVSAMVPVKSVLEYETQQEVTVMFVETLNRAIETGLLTRDAVDYCDPAIMFALPRLAIITGLIHYPDGPLNVERPVDKMSPLFRTYHPLLKKIRNHLRELSTEELRALEVSLCTNEEPSCASKSSATDVQAVEVPPRRRSHSTSREGKVHECKFSPGSVNRAGHLAEQLNCEESSSGVSFESAVDSSPETVERSSNNSSSDDANNTTALVRRRVKPALIHRLFVCISGVADQLQVNYPSDTRSILKIVLQPPQLTDEVHVVEGQSSQQDAPEEETGQEARESPQNRSPQRRQPPLSTLTPGVVRWVPDSEAPTCSACAFPFTFVRRRHHCRNCGRVYCNACSNNFMPIPELGYESKVRVCNRCALRVNPFDEPHAPQRPAHDAIASPTHNQNQQPTTSTLS